jgi:hypothetical protein
MRPACARRLSSPDCWPLGSSQREPVSVAGHRPDKPVAASPLGSSPCPSPKLRPRKNRCSERKCGPFFKRCVPAFRRSRHSERPCVHVETCSSRFSPCVTSWRSFVGQIDVFARRTVYSGCACDGGGLGGGRRSYWSSRRRSPGGIVKGCVDAGAADRRGDRADYASTHSFEPSFGVWPRRTVFVAVRGSTASC